MATTDLPSLIGPEWLAIRLHWPDLVVLDTTVELTFPPDGPYTLAPGRPGYLEGHVPGAVFADQLSDLSDPEAPDPLTVPTAG